MAAAVAVSVAFSVMAAAVAVSVAFSVVAAAVAVSAAFSVMSATSAVGVPAVAMVDIFPMKSLFQFLFGCFTY